MFPSISWAISDQERAKLIKPLPGHDHKFGVWFRAEPYPGALSNRYQRRCKCGHIQYGRGNQYGLHITPEKRDADFAY